MHLVPHTSTSLLLYVQHWLLGSWKYVETSVDSGCHVVCVYMYVQYTSKPLAWPGWSSNCGGMQAIVCNAKSGRKIEIAMCGLVCGVYTSVTIERCMYM